MKKRVLCIGLVLALALTIIMPATAVAKGLVDFHAAGTVLGIDQGDVKAAGNSGRWIVKDRNLIGAFIDFEGSPYVFFLNYHASIDSVYTQAGNIQGVLSVGDTLTSVDPPTLLHTLYTLNVTGTTDPAYPSGAVDENGNPLDWYLIPGPDPLDPLRPWMMVADYDLHLDGSWTFTDGAVGNGTFDANVILQICLGTFYPEQQGHIVGFPVGSTFSLDGHWKP